MTFWNKFCKSGKIWVHKMNTSYTYLNQHTGGFFFLMKSKLFSPTIKSANSANNPDTGEIICNSWSCLQITQLNMKILLKIFRFRPVFKLCYYVTKLIEIAIISKKYKFIRIYWRKQWYDIEASRLNNVIWNWKDWFQENYGSFFYKKCWSNTKRYNWSKRLIYDLLAFQWASM